MNYNFYKLSIIDIYKKILSGEVKSFPNGTWTHPDGLINASIITKYLIEERLKWTDDDIKNNFSKNVFKENKLGGMLMQVFKDSPIDALNNIYPNRFCEWQLIKTSKKYWNKDTCILATKWLLEEKLNWKNCDPLPVINQQIFYKNGLSGMLVNFYHSSPYLAINDAYPNKFKVWEVTKVNKWYDEMANDAVKWLVEEKLMWTLEKVEKELSQNIFYLNGLQGLLTVHFRNSPYLALKSAYPKYNWENLKSIFKD